MHFWGGSSSCLSICLMKDNHLLETKLAEGRGAEAACAISGQMIHQMCSRDLAMLQVKGQTRPQEDIRVNAQLAPVAICTVRQRKAMGGGGGGFQNVSLFWEGVLLYFLTNGFAPKSSCFLTISDTIKKIVLLTCCIYYTLKRTFLICENVTLKWQNYSDKFTELPASIHIQYSLS